ncbi:MAG: hypothetical protein PVF17_02210 [Ignavibacteria bacterium]|jgi:hypothetical protein
MIKIISALSIAFFLLTACTKEESKLELFNPDAFAYDLGNSWEVNAIINVKGFEQNENDERGLFEAAISYAADLQTPNGNIISNVFSDNIEYSLGEEIIDIPLEIQFELDSTYVLGKYQINLTVEDDYSGNVVKGVIKFDLKE